MKIISGIVVVAFAVFMTGLALTIFVRPLFATRFLNGFAGSARVHYTEQAVRLVVGGSLVAFSSEMWQPDVFHVFGWIMVATTVGLLLIPWRWHNRFAQWVIPPVIRFMTLYGVATAACGLFILYAVLL